MNEALLKDLGWEIECESPLEIRHEDGSFASGYAAIILYDHLEEENSESFKVRERLREIINTNSWIKVKKFDESQSRFRRFPQVELEEFKKHHIKETDFLLGKCRELAKELLEHYEEEA